jgi:hypothetical protein
MAFRVIAVLLAVVLLWSGLNTFETEGTPAQATQEHLAAASPSDAPLPAAPEGTAAHHLDELPAQAWGDPSTETPALLPTRLAPRSALMALAVPRALASAGVATPFLAGPLRPPCRAALAA